MARKGLQNGELCVCVCVCVTSLYRGALAKLCSVEHEAFEML